MIGTALPKPTGGSCDRHGQFHGYVCVPCSDERHDARLARQRRDDVRQWWKDHAAKVDGIAGLPSWAWAEFGNAEWESRCAPEVLDAAKAWRPGKGAVLCWPTGGGKSSTLVAAVKAWAGRVSTDATEPLSSWVYCTALDLVEATRRRRLGGSAHPLVERAQRSHVAIIDEAHALPPELAMEILDARYRAGLTTVVAAGVSAKKLGRIHGAATLRRLLEGGPVVNGTFPEEDQ